MSGLLPASTDDPLARAVRLLWPNLPMLAFGSALVASAWAGMRLVSGDAGWLLIIGVGMVVFPVLAAVVHGCQVLLDGDHFGIPALLRGLPRDAVRAAGVTAVPTAAAVLTHAALLAWRLSHAAWMVPSVAVGVVVSAAAVGVGVVAMPYHLRAGSRWRETWLVAAYIAGRNPVPVLAVAAAVMLTVWSTAHLSFALVLLLPGPLAMVWAAAVTTAVRRSRDHLAATR
jgi:hypothetical protein